MSLLAAGATLIGGLLGSASQSDANDANLQATRETNETNVALTRETNELAHQMEHEARAWDEQQAAIANQIEDERYALERANDLSDLEDHRAYNDPAAARKRAEDAGFNPLTVNDQSGTQVGSTASYGAVATPSGARAPALQTPQIGRHTAQAFEGWSEAFSQFSAQQIQMAKLDMQKQELEHRLREATVKENVGGIYSQRSVTKRGKVPTTVASDPVPAGLPIRIGGQTFDPNQRFSDAEDVEQRIGDVGSAAYGLAVAGADLKFNNYILKRRDEGVIDLSFLKEEYDRKGKRPKARRDNFLTFPDKITEKELESTNPRIRWRKVKNVNWYPLN